MAAIIIPGRNGPITTGSFASSVLDGSESDGTNLVTGGDIGFWATVNASATVNQADWAGGTAATRFIGDTSDDRHMLYENESPITADTAHTFSVYAKQVNYRYLSFLLVGGGGPKVYAYYDLQTPAVTDSGVISAGTHTAVNSTNIQTAANGFYKCSINYKIDNASTNIFLQVCLSNVATYGAPLQFDSPKFAGANGTDYLLVGRAKLTAP